MPRRLAYFISSHGFGHAARACAVIEAIWRHDATAAFELFTATPEWFFSASLRGPYRHHAGAVDLGLVQTTALEEDLEATVEALGAEIPFSSERVERLARRLGDLGCEAVLCDIAPLGLLVARRAGLPGVLIENFTWDWIYRGYLDEAPALEPIVLELERIVELADLHLQTEPFCRRHPDATTVAPISRAPRLPRSEVRRRLGVPPDAALLMLTMGGIEWDYSALGDRLEASQDGEAWLLIAGGSARFERQGRILRLPHRSELYHPDLIHAADAVIGKLGYSTLAEVAHAGLPFGYVGRSRFPESAVLEDWVKRHLPHLRISAAALSSGAFLEHLGPLLAQIGSGSAAADGGEEIARHLLALP